MFKNLTFAGFAGILLNIFIPAHTQGVTSPYEVATWPEFRSAAISYTFDDGCSNQFAVAVPIFNEFGFGMTLFVPTDSVDDWQLLVSAADSGHEIANHTISHGYLNQLTKEQQDYELSTSNALIDEHVTSQKCVTLAYPYCVTGNDSICKKKFIAARGCSGSIEPKTPANMYNVSSVICGTQGVVKTEANFKTYADNAVKKTGWLVYLFHGVDNDGGWSSTSSVEIRKSLEYLDSDNSKFWVAPFGTVARYIRERNSLKIEETSVLENKITILVSDTMDNTLFNLPVTIRRQLPDGWYAAGVYQGETDLDAFVTAVNNIMYVTFNVIPDGSAIDIIWKDNTGVQQKGIHGSGICNFRVENEDLFFSVPETSIPQVNIAVFSLNGTLLRVYNKCKLSEGKGAVNLGDLPRKPGIYLIKLSSPSSVWTHLLKI